MQNLVWLEIAGAVGSILYSLFLMFEKKVGWWFGIASSIIGVVLFYQTKLYAQSLISLYFAGIGFYGLWYWNRAEKSHTHILTWPIKMHWLWCALGIMVSMLVAKLFVNYTDSSMPYVDSFVTIFGFIASIKEARKILTSWVYWGVINVISAWLYYKQDLAIYGWLMLVYACVCIPGYINWLKIYRAHKTSQSEI